MLDNDLKNQLTEIFKPLNKEIEILYHQSSHSSQNELLDLLNEIPKINSKIQLKTTGLSSESPAFSISLKGIPARVHFKGIPGGHEFSSFVLAILNLGGLGKLPDSSIVERIKNLKGPIKLRTFISLTCENCPDVVQNLNLMTIYNEHIEHEMIDGGLWESEVARLGIQGVPAVFNGDTLIHSGKSSFIDLLTLLEKTYGKKEDSIAGVAKDLGEFDVVVVGGGPAGASAAIYSVRKGLKTALIAEKFGGQVQDTKGIENLIGITYTEGPELAAQLMKHVSQYPVQILEHRRVLKVENGTLKKLTLDSREYLKTKSLIVTTGAKWRELGIPGEKEYIGRGVAFCPHCDGPYYKAKKVAVIGGGNSGVEAAIDLAGIVREVVLIEFADKLKADQVLIDKLKSLPNVSFLVNTKSEEVLGDGTKVIGLKIQNRSSQDTSKIDLDGIFVQIGLLPNSAFIKDVVKTSAFGEIIVDEKGRSSVEGIYAAGDVTTTPYKQIIIAMGEGAKAALASFEDQMRAPLGKL